MTGRIKTLVQNKKFGFIKGPDNKDYFFHETSLNGISFHLLQEGMKMEFEIVKSHKGPRAENVTYFNQVTQS